MYPAVLVHLPAATAATQRALKFWQRNAARRKRFAASAMQLVAEQKTRPNGRATEESGEGDKSTTAPPAVHGRTPRTTDMHFAGGPLFLHEFTMGVLLRSNAKFPQRFLRSYRVRDGAMRNQRMPAEN